MIVGKMSSVSPAYSDHWLVESIDHSLNTYTTYTCSGDKVAKMERKWKADDKTVFRIDYGGGADIYSAEKAIENARREYQQKWQSSDEFVTKMKTGQKYSVEEQCPLGDEAQSALFTKSHIHSLEEIRPGDHIMITSLLRQAKHLLIVDAYLQGKKYLAYTTDGDGKVERIENKWKESSHIFRISYPSHAHSTLVDPVEAIDNADNEYHKWNSSDEFVTLMKTGKCYSLAQQCLFSPDNNIVGYTLITPDTAVDEGDHIILQDALDMYHSVYLYKNITGSTFAIMPNIKGDGSLYGEVDIAQYQIHRINYKQCLPPDQSQIRACSEKGESLLRENMHDPSLFISWAKIGKQIPVNPGDLKIVPPQKKNLPGNDEPTPKRSQQIAQLCPLFYETIHSADDIQVGDHIIQSHLPYWFHCMVTEREVNPVDPTQFRAIYQFRTCIEEKEISLDPSTEKLYRIKYLESLPTDIAIENARSRLGERSLSPMARMKFVRWAKTGSEEGIEVDFLTNEALPVSKSRVWSFGQLNRGDYLVEVANKTRTHHYLVTEVHSPITCLAIESWSPSGTVGRVTETTVSFEESHEFYRINYNHGACFTTEETVQNAESLIDSSTKDKMWSDINRQKFVNFVKTGESEVIEVSQLKDDRLLLPRKKVESALELQPGDHLERPVRGAKMFNHHMIVIKAVNKRRCKVIHFGISDGKKSELLEEEVDLFVNDCVFRIHYSERINPADTIRILRELIESPTHQVGTSVGI